MCKKEKDSREKQLGYPSSFDITVLIFQNHSFAILAN